MDLSQSTAMIIEQSLTKKRQGAATEQSKAKHIKENNGNSGNMGPPNSRTRQ